MSFLPFYRLQFSVSDHRSSVKVVNRGRAPMLAPALVTSGATCWSDMKACLKPFLHQTLFFTFRAASCVQVLPAQGKVTSLDLSSDHRQLLSCCRDDCLQLFDLRRWSNERVTFRYVRTRRCSAETNFLSIRLTFVCLFVSQSRRVQMWQRQHQSRHQVSHMISDIRIKHYKGQ